MIAIQGLSRFFGSKILFEDVDLQLNAGCRYGVVGANGSGKTTFLKILMGEDEPSSGVVSISKKTRIGFLVQDRFESLAQPISQVVMMGHEELWHALKEKEQLLQTDSSDSMRIAELEEEIAVYDGYTLESKAGQILEGLGISTAVHHEPLETLSGGFQLRVLLAQALVANPEILILDEPTNHLDIFSIRWLESFLSNYAGVVIVVSHDQRFLDNLSTHVLDVDYETITLYTGNYSFFHNAKSAERARREAENEKREREKAQHQQFVDRFRAKATKARQAQSRLKQIDKIEIESLAQTSRRFPHMDFVQARPSGRDVLTIENLSKSYGDLKVLEDLDLLIRRQERVAIIGPNGVGKSTLLKIAVREIEQDAGQVEWGHETQIGYFPQDHSEITNHSGHALSWIWERVPEMSESAVRGKLGNYLFTGDDVKKTLSNLSGGEAARVLLCGIQVLSPNVLVLDEPTNHLDIEAIESLISALHRFDGTVIFVSHNRHFISQVANRIIDIKPSGLENFVGTYDEYLQNCGEDYLDVESQKKEASQRTERQASEGTTQSEWQKKKETLKQVSRLNKQLEKVTHTVDALEKQLEKIEQQFCDPLFYETHQRDEIAKMEDERRTVVERLDAAIEEWESLESQIEKLQNGGD